MDPYIKLRVFIFKIEKIETRTTKPGATPEFAVKVSFSEGALWLAGWLAGQPAGSEAQQTHTQTMCFEYV